MTITAFTPQVNSSDSTRQIPLNHGLFATVDARDYERLAEHNWRARYNKNGKCWYAFRTSLVEGKTLNIQMAREVLGLATGDPRQADHEHHRTLRNTRDELRIARPDQNCMNRRTRSDNASGFKGVSWNSRICKAGKWRVQIMVGGKNLLVGHFTDKVAAAEAYDDRARREFGEFAFLNFPVPAAQSELPLAA